MEKIIIAGTNEFSEYVYYTVSKEHIVEVVAFTTLKETIQEDSFCNLPIYPLEELFQKFNGKEFQVLITVGYTKMNKRRENTYNICKKIGYKICTYISTRAVCDSESVGEGCLIMPLAYVPPLTTLGLCNVINTATVLGHTSKVGDFNWFAGNVVTGGNVIIDNRCFLGMYSLVKNGIHVASETMIGAYSYLSEDSVENRFYSGNPAVNTKKLKSDVVCDFI